MSPVEKEHIIRAYTFELGKCYDQAIKERQLQCLANIDPVLCEQVATGLGLPAPEPTVPLADVAPSPALSQVGREWPADGRMVGIVVDPDGDLDGVARGTPGRVRRRHGAAADRPARRHGRRHAGAADLRHRPVGRVRRAPARRRAGTGAGRAARPATPRPAAPASATVDPRVLLLVEECWRHAKAIGAWGAGVGVLEQAGVAGTPGRGQRRLRRRGARRRCSS